MSLRTLEFRQHPDADGFVRLQVPVEAVDQRYRVIILIEPEVEPGTQRRWSPGFILRYQQGTGGALRRNLAIAQPSLSMNTRLAATRVRLYL